MGSKSREISSGFLEDGKKNGKNEDLGGKGGDSYNTQRPVSIPASSPPLRN
jgi:hypothetical protein